MPIHVRPISDADHNAVAALFAEMQAHYDVPCPPIDSMLGDLSALPAGVEIFIAETGSIAGFAAISTIYPGPGLKSGFFLKELYVAAAYRGQGVGRTLMRALSRIAVERGHGRIDWTADQADRKLMAFYEDLGGRPETKKVFFRLTGDALHRLAERD